MFFMIAISYNFIDARHEENETRNVLYWGLVLLITQLYFLKNNSYYLSNPKKKPWDIETMIIIITFIKR